MDLAVDSFLHPLRSWPASVPKPETLDQTMGSVSGKPRLRRLRSPAAVYNNFNIQRPLTSAQTHRSFWSAAIRRMMRGGRADPNFPPNSGSWLKLTMLPEPYSQSISQGARESASTHERGYLLRYLVRPQTRARHAED
jgi:hypothetical protein